MKAGLTLYDLLAGRHSPLPRHKFRTSKEALARHPALNPEIVSAATYYDAQVTCPERLCLELVLDAEALSPRVRAVNYAGVKGAAGDTVFLQDEVSGGTCRVRPRVVANASGPWIDRTNSLLGRESHFIGGTKGSHVVVDQPELVRATEGEMIYFVNRDGRICLFYPIGDKILAGSTDLPTDEPDEICEETEVSYLLESLQQAFPSIRVDRSRVVFQFCGVRPLPRKPARTPGEISRDHSLPVLLHGGGVSFPIYSLVGGKWTTFRAFAEQTADEILRELGQRRVRSSVDRAIGGGKGYPQAPEARKNWIAAARARTGVPEERLARLLDRYGTRAEEVAIYLQGGPDTTLACHAGYSRREIEFLALYERVVHLEDLILRRTLIGLRGESTYRLLEEVAAIAGEALGWPPGQINDEIEHTVRRLERVHGVTPAQLGR